MNSLKLWLLRKENSSRMFDMENTSTQTPLHPFRIRLTGSVKIEGLVKQEWIKEIIKKLSLVLACRLGSSRLEWEQLSPFLFVALRKTLNDNLVFNSLKSTNITQRIYSKIDQKYLSMLSYLPESFYPRLETLSHKWEFESSLKKLVFVICEINCAVETYDYRRYDDILVEGYLPFPDISFECETACHNVFLKCKERPLDMNCVMEAIAPEVSRLKKLLYIKSELISRSKYKSLSIYDPSAPK